MKRKRINEKQRRKLYDKYNGKCAYCGHDARYEDMQLDHVKPICHGGIDDISNMLPACRSCNHRKGSESLESFRQSVERFLTVLKRDSVTYRNAVRYGLVTPTPRRIVFYFEKLRKEDIK
jgi:5-methylcytosine-specific restriction endonuclease McrA